MGAKVTTLDVQTLAAAEECSQGFSLQLSDKGVIASAPEPAEGDKTDIIAGQVGRQRSPNRDLMTKISECVIEPVRGIDRVSDLGIVIRIQRIVIPYVHARRHH